MDWKESFLALLGWLEGQGAEAALWLVLLQAALVLLALPGPVFTAAAGFLFGIAGGMGVSLLGSMLGSVAAYGIARMLPRGTMDAALAEREGGRTWVRLLRRMVRVGGWRIVLTTRLIPLFPFKLSNYLFGWVRFPFRDFVVGTLLGIVPMTAVSVTAGSLASDVAVLFRADAGTGGGRWVGSLVALTLAVAAFVYAGWLGRRELRALRAEDAAVREGYEATEREGTDSRGPSAGQEHAS